MPKMLHIVLVLLIFHRNSIIVVKEQMYGYKMVDGGARPREESINKF